MKKGIFFILIGIFLISFTSAVYNAGLFEKDKVVDLKLPCSYNGTFCSTSAKCNITTRYPNGSYQINNQIMTNTGNGLPNMTLNKNNETGEYSGFYICCEEGYCDSSSIIFQITPNGRVLSTAQGILYIIFLLGVLFIFSLCLYGSIKIRWHGKISADGRILGSQDLRYFKIILIAFSYLLAVSITGIMRSIFTNFLLYDNASQVFNWLFWILFSFIFPILVLSVLMMIIVFIDNKRLESALKRGVPLRR